MIDRIPIPPLTGTWPELTEETAYAIAAATLALRGVAAVGFKLGYTSAAMRAQMNIDAPNYGVLTAEAALASGARIEPGVLIHPLIEPEIALSLNRTIDEREPSRSDLLAAVEAVFPALEIVDTRYERYEFRAVDNIADNSSSARFVLGAPIAPRDAGDLRTVEAVLSANGAELDRGIGANALDDPLLALGWLAQRLAREGRPLARGDVVLTGGLTRAYPARAGDTFVAAFSGLGRAEISFGGDHGPR